MRNFNFELVGIATAHVPLHHDCGLTLYTYMYSYYTPSSNITSWNMLSFFDSSNKRASRKNNNTATGTTCVRAATNEQRCVMTSRADVTNAVICQCEVGRSAGIFQIVCYFCCVFNYAISNSWKGRAVHRIPTILAQKQNSSTWIFGNRNTTIYGTSCISPDDAINVYHRFFSC